MIYEFQCQECKHEFAKTLPIHDRDLPLNESCPECSRIGTIKRSFNSLSISYSGFKSTVARAGSGWNDVLNKIKKGSGKHNTVRTR